MLMHISPRLSMWIFYISGNRQDSTAFLPTIDQNATKYKGCKIYRQFSPKFVVHIIHIIHIFVWKSDGENTLFSFEISCAIMQVT